MIHHGSQKEPEPDDPCALVGTNVMGGNLRLMAECLVEEFANLGWPEKAIVQMFYNPFYQAAHLYFQQYGKQEVHSLVRDVLARCQIVMVTIDEQPVETCPEEENDHA